MKKLGIALLLIAVAMAMLISAVLIKLTAQRQAIEARGPLTLEGVDKLAAKWEAAAGGASPESPNAVPEEVSSGQTVEARRGDASEARAGPVVEPDSSPSPSTAASRPVLRRTLTRAEKEQLAEQVRQENHTRLGTLVGPAVEFLATAGLSLGLDEAGGGGHYREAAQIAYHAGDWVTAERLYRQALDYPLNSYCQRDCCLRLAWMEDDPEVATRLLDLACPPDDESPVFLSQAAYLANRTGSQDLCEHYRARLRALDADGVE